MSTQLPTTVSLGELIVTTFDIAGRFGTDPQDVSELATSAITNLLRRALPAALVVADPRLRLCRIEGIPSSRSDRALQSSTPVRGPRLVRRAQAQGVKSNRTEALPKLR